MCRSPVCFVEFVVVVLKNRVELEDDSSVAKIWVKVRPRFDPVWGGGDVSGVSRGWHVIGGG